MTGKSLMSKKQSHRTRVIEKFNRSYLNNISTLINFHPHLTGHLIPVMGSESGMVEISSEFFLCFSESI